MLLIAIIVHLGEVIVDANLRTITCAQIAHFSHKTKKKTLFSGGFVCCVAQKFGRLTFFFQQHKFLVSRNDQSLQTKKKKRRFLEETKKIK